MPKWFASEIKKRRECVLDLLCVGGAFSSRQLGDAVGVSPRTIHRDITMMRADGHRIEGAAGFGYMLRPREQRILWPAEENTESD
jgi:predicted DNA-binding transcriptional regulator YafY